MEKLSEFLDDTTPATAQYMALVEKTEVVIKLVHCTHGERSLPQEGGLPSTMFREQHRVASVRQLEDPHDMATVLHTLPPRGLSIS